MKNRKVDCSSLIGEDPAIALYESMPNEEVEKELQRAGINPQPTVEAVKNLIREKLKTLTCRES